MNPFDIEFLILSRREAEDEKLINSNAQKPYFWVSINGTDEPPANIVKNINCVGSIALHFDDVTHDLQGYIPMHPSQAMELVKAIDAIKDKVKLILVHCAAGISRSSATAAAISTWLTGSDQHIFQTPYYKPNSHVYSLITRAVERYETHKKLEEAKCQPTT